MKTMVHHDITYETQVYISTSYEPSSWYTTKEQLMHNIPAGLPIIVLSRGAECNSGKKNFAYFPQPHQTVDFLERNVIKSPRQSHQ
jgi:hypothetical protein